MAVEKAIGSSSLAEVIDRIVDKGDLSSVSGSHRDRGKLNTIPWSMHTVGEQIPKRSLSFSISSPSSGS